DPSALYAFLSALPMRASTTGTRVVRIPAYDAADRTPPLPAEDLDLVLSASRTLRQLKPDWAAAFIALSVTTELNRANRRDEADALYREIVRSATDLFSISGACALAAERGDVDALLKLLDAFERAQGLLQGSYTSVQSSILTSQGYVAAPYTAMAQAMRV